jgi:heat shock protein HtpX
MSSYVGIHSQIVANNRKSVALLIAFPLLVLFPFAVISYFAAPENGEYWKVFLGITPFVLGGVLIWFLIAYYSHDFIIRHATMSDTLQRKDHMRIYNLTENLCMGVGMPMPRLQVIETPALNAFASGLNPKTYTVTLTRGIINALNDEELEGVIAHELMHIRNRDVRLLVISIIFVGILSFMAQAAFRLFIHGAGRRNRSGKDKSGAIIWLVAMVAILVAYALSVIFKFALSRKREYMADAGAADMTKRPLALASALRKISGNHDIPGINDELKQMFIANHVKGESFSLSSILATHPPIQKRIQFLENV